MATLMLNSSISYKQREIVKAAINIPRRVARIKIPGLRTGGFPEQTEKPLKIITLVENGNPNPNQPDPTVVAKLYAIMEAVADRVEMHRNVGEQRDNWNSLLLTSINSMTLAAAAMAGIAAAAGGSPAAALKISSTVMYVAATCMLSVMNKIQPSQLAEEQRNGARLFKQLHNQIQTVISMGNPTAADVREMMERVLALDKAFPLPLLGAMLEKFPAAVEPAVSWPEQRRRKAISRGNAGYNGWNGKLEEEMRQVIRVVRVKDKQDYLRLGEKALKLNKFLAVTGPVLTGLAALGSALVGECRWAAAVAVVGGALASVVNSLEHGGQVGMVFEMYRSNAGFFKMMEESIEWNLKEGDLERRENGEVFEMKVALQLGRSLSQLRDLDVDEFASKLF
ncbi:probable F-box protein At4g22030 [Salvia miltiorrhiza]|uniref:probable F-box protein At4g22030 n=1 Tax=Salvia miltiorrhiza TaxID=226208 RepID=UPI0025AD82C0|nr:probable F-box protein At4g22030 [Salvia miltiorrhiza]